MEDVGFWTYISLIAINSGGINDSVASSAASVAKNEDRISSKDCMFCSSIFIIKPYNHPQVG